MSKIILFIAAALLVASAGLSFVNKSKLTTKNAELADTQKTATAAQSDATKAKAAQKTAENNAAAAVTKASDAQTALTAAQGQLTDLNGKLDAVTKSVAEKDAKITELNTLIAAAPKTPTGDVISPDAKKIDELTKERDELKLVKDGLEGQAKAAQAQAEVLRHQIAVRASGESMLGLRGQVLAVDHNWNFVVLNLGGHNGVNNNATMIIQRGGSMVGRVKITSVEPSQSVADILPNSVPSGVEVRPGDTVVFPGS